MYSLRLELLGTSGCHLCDQAEALLVGTLNLNLVEVVLVDIAEADDLMQQYATRIPVLRNVEGGQCLDWPFDAQALTQFVSAT